VKAGKELKMSRPWKKLRLMASLLVLAATRAGARVPAMPGTVNHVEGQVTFARKRVSEEDGPITLTPGEWLEVAQGRTEILLTPGVFLRTGDNSRIRVDLSSRSSAGIELAKGNAILEVNALADGTVLLVAMDRTIARITKPGLYFFAADQQSISVIAGEATVNPDQSHITLKKGRSMTLVDGQKLKLSNLDPAAIENDPLYQWSQLRSQLEAQAGYLAAQDIGAGGVPYDSWWHWDAPMECYIFLPAAGVFYSYFGWGYYAPPIFDRRPHPIHYHPVKGQQALSAFVHPEQAYRGGAGAGGARSFAGPGAGGSSGGGGGHFGGGGLGGGGHFGGGGGAAGGGGGAHR
jgi:hypothetical protein